MKKLKIKKSTFLSDFKKFITKGNIVDLAVAVVIGTAFSAIVNSLVKDIIMPLLTLATGDGVEGLSLVLNNVPKYLADGTINPDAVLWSYGNFLQAIINFIIIALCIFTALRFAMKLKNAGGGFLAKQKKSIEAKLRKGKITESEAEEFKAVAEAAAEVKVTEVDLLVEIRDALKRLESTQITQTESADALSAEEKA